MEPPEQLPSTPPKRRGRRSLIVALLVVPSAAAWWYWPTGDARFVGKWELQRLQLNGSAFVNLKPKPQFHLELRSNGSAVVRSLTTFRNGPLQIGPPLYTRWKVDQDALIVGNPDKLPVSSYLASFAKVLKRYFSMSLMSDSGFRLTIASVESNEIELTTPGTSMLPGASARLNRSRLIRISE